MNLSTNQAITTKAAAGAVTAELVEQVLQSMADTAVVHKRNIK